MTSSDAHPRPLPSPPTKPQRSNSGVPQDSTEKENQNPKSKRPLPVPKEVQPASTATFYATSPSVAKPAPLRAGSSHTAFSDAVKSPPPQHAKETTPFREPELIQVDQVASLAANDGASWDTPTDQFPVAASSWGTVEETPWDPASWSATGWNTAQSRGVDIDGRSESEELNWADKELRAKSQRPGPGILPPLLAQVLHNPDHTLYNVTATAPDPTLTHSRAGSTSTANAPPSPGVSVSPPPSAHASHTPPSQEEVRTSIPHPNAYYCKEHHGWVLLFWKSSPQLPPLSSSFKPPYPLPDQARRRLNSTCVHKDEHATSHANKTHHFHKYERAVDARDLMTPYKRSDWEVEARKKQRRRKMTIHLDDSAPEPAPTEEPPEEPEGDMLDLYLCCQCSTYCLVSQVIPGVIPLRTFEEFNKDKLDHPQLGKSPEVTLVTGWETVITCVHL